jgi:hypothetical protein
MENQMVSDELWEEFHRVVNMTSRELSDWLRVQSADEETEALPDQSGNALGQQVLGVLGKRRRDLTDDDVDTMTTVVDIVHRERRADLEPTAGDDAWRRRLMAIGHDPLKPS